MKINCHKYSVFQGFRQVKSANGGSILSSSQFLILSQLPQKVKLASKVVKVDSKIIILLPKIEIPETHCSLHTACFMNLDKLNLVRTPYYSLIFRQFSLLPQLPQKMAPGLKVTNSVWVFGILLCFKRLSKKHN